MRVVVVDDEIQIARSLQRLLRAHYDVRTASSGDECLRLLAEAGADALLTDYRMPGMTGLELIAEVRRRHPHVTCALITGYADVEDATVPVIAKPWDRATLVAQLAELCAKGAP